MAVEKAVHHEDMEMTTSIEIDRNAPKAQTEMVEEVSTAPPKV
jgi:hypothetical protein